MRIIDQRDGTTLVDTDLSKASFDISVPFTSINEVYHITTSKGYIVVISREELNSLINRVKKAREQCNLLGSVESLT